MNIYWTCVLCWALCWSLAREGERERWHLWPHTIHRHLRWYWKGSGIQKNTQAIVNDLTGLGRVRSSSRVGKERHRTPCRQHRERKNHLQGSQMTSPFLPTGQRRSIEREAHRKGWQAEWGILKDGDKLSGPSARDQFVMTQIRVTLAI